MRFAFPPYGYCNPLGEETEAWEKVRFEPDLGRAILAGYLPLVRDFLTDHDYAYLYDAIRLLTFELGLRFLTDYLAGNVYFKARHREHNLARALVQFKLCDSIEIPDHRHPGPHPGPEMTARSSLFRAQKGLAQTLLLIYLGKIAG